MSIERSNSGRSAQSTPSRRLRRSRSASPYNDENARHSAPSNTMSTPGNTMSMAQIVPPGRPIPAARPRASSSLSRPRSELVSQTWDEEALEEKDLMKEKPLPNPPPDPSRVYVREMNSSVSSLESNFVDPLAKRSRIEPPVYNDQIQFTLRASQIRDKWAHGSRLDENPGDDGQNSKTQKGYRLWLLITAACLTVSVITLDSTIVATVIPKLVETWHAPNDVGWYGTAYLLPMPVLQPAIGKLYPYGNTKWLFLLGGVIFAGGSLTCALSESSIMFIMGRMVAGIGGATLTPGMLLIIADVVPKHKRPAIAGLNSLAGGAAASLGPIVGGVLTTKATWRWCFYLNLPMLAIVAVLTLIFYDPLDRSSEGYDKWTQVLFSFDPLGVVIMSGVLVAFLLGLTFAAEDGWGAPDALTLFVAAGVLLIFFIVEQYFIKDEYALLPKRILKQKGVLICAIFGFCVQLATTSHNYYLPMYFQSARGESALDGGVDVLPYMITQTLSGIIGAGIVQRAGLFNPIMILGSAIFTTGAGIFQLLSPTTSTGEWIGLQIVAGLGSGWCSFMAMGMAQQLLDRRDESIGLAMVYMLRMLGASVSVSICSNIYNTTLGSNLSAQGIPGRLVAVVVAGIQNSNIPDRFKVGISQGVTDSLHTVFIVPTAAAGLAFLLSLLQDWRRIVKPARS